MQMREIEFPAHSLSATLMFVGVLCLCAAVLLFCLGRINSVLQRAFTSKRLTANLSIVIVLTM